MSGGWRVAFKLTDDERQLVLSRVRPALMDAPPGNPLTVVLRAFEAQVVAGDDVLELPVDRLDVIGKIHWSRLLSGLSTPSGHVRCEHCRGLGEVDLPSQLTNLPGQFDYDFSLSQLGPPERQIYLDQPADPVVRQRQEAERRVEAEKQRDAVRRSEQRSYGVLPGSPRAEAAPEGSPDFMPARGR